MLNTNLVQNECRNKKIVVLKVIRYEEIEQLKFLKEEMNLDVKVFNFKHISRFIFNLRVLSYIEFFTTYWKLLLSFYSTL